MMQKKMIFMLILIIITMFFVAGCTKTAVEPTPEEQPSPEEKGDEAVNEISTDISDIEAMDDDLDIQDLDSLAQDLNDLDW